MNKYPVIKLDIPTVFSDMDKTNPFEVAFNQCILKDIYKYYPTVEKENFSSVAEAIFYLYEQKKFVFIIDEWDAIFREYSKDIEDQKSYIQILRDLFKSNASNSIALCYMTGILPIKKYNTESALNNFDEYTMLDPATMAPYIGFTQEEVKPLCEKYSMDFNDIKAW